MTTIVAANVFKNIQNNKLIEENKIEAAIDSSRLQLLDLFDFMKVTGDMFDTYMVKKFFHSMDSQIPIYLDKELIKWCGYEGTIADQKKSIMRVVKNYDIPYYELPNNEYHNFKDQIVKLINDNSQFYQGKIVPINDNSENDITDIMYPNIKPGTGKSNILHKFFEPDDFKLLVMRIQTSTGKNVCKYYIEFEKLIKLYLRYQLEFKIRREKLLEIELKESREERQKLKTDINQLLQNNQQLQDSVDELKEDIHNLSGDIKDVSQKLDVAVEDRVPKTINNDLFEKIYNYEAK